MSASWNAWKIKQARQAADIERLERELDRAGVRIEQDIWSTDAASGYGRPVHITRPKADAGALATGRRVASPDAASKPTLWRLIARWFA